ncbi:MAG: ABC transporter transmembrane domain-containing protein, partial [Chloroflexota bacterium]
MMGNRDWAWRQEARKPTAVRQTLGRFWRYFRRFSHVLLLVALLVVVSTYLQVKVPDLLGQAVDCYLTPATQASLLQHAPAAAAAAVPAAKTNCWYASLGAQATSAQYLTGLGRLVLLIAGIYVVSSLLTGLQFYLMTYVGQNVLRALRVDVFAHIHRLSLGYFTKHEAGDVMSRITNDADTIQQAISFPLVSVVQGSLLIVWVALTMLHLNPIYALIALAVSPLMFWATSWFSAQARNAYRQVRTTVGDVNASLQENLSA